MYKKVTSYTFQGIEGANSHLAGSEIFANAKPLPCNTFEETFNKAETGQADVAFIPIENSLGGRVADIHHLLPSTKLRIVGEYFFWVHHVLLAKKGSKISDIKEVFSHPQAIAQCRKSIKRLGLKERIYSDTAAAAKKIQESTETNIAAIASPLAAKIYDLDILHDRFEDNLTNITRFMIMSNNQDICDSLYPKLTDDNNNKNTVITSLFFGTRSIPAALYKCLGGFATNGVNLLKLESYINISNNEDANFYAEIEGNPREEKVTRALDELNLFSRKVTILGCYNKHEKRP